MQQLAKNQFHLAQAHIEVSLAQTFDEDDIAALSNAILLKIDDAQELEEILGADRLNLRFTALGHNFVLNFEIYSQSCWIEVESGIDNEALTLLYQQLSH